MKELANFPIVYQQIVAWGDMDAFKHVNNVQYYRYMESARIEYMNKVKVLAERIATVVASSQCQYLSPVFYPDVLHIGVRVDELRNSAFRMSYILWSEKQQKKVAIGESVMVCVDPVTTKKSLIPDAVRQKIIQLEAEAAHIL